MGAGHLLLMGAYGQRNLGDDALLEVFLTQLHGEPLMVNSATPRATSERYGVATLPTYGLWPSPALMRGLLAVDGLKSALNRQRHEGGRLSESIVALGLMSSGQMAAVLDETPASPRTVEQTGISRVNLLALLLKAHLARSSRPGSPTGQVHAATNVPASALLGRLEWAQVGWLFGVAAVWFTLAVALFHRGIRRYTSASS